VKSLDNYRVYVLQSKGVNGKFIRTLVNMYKNLQSCVKTSSGTVTDYFPCNIGTRQGDISSPTIFFSVY